MDTRAIEVIIGLVLVFAVTSLLVSTLHELWAASLKSRGDNLLMGVASLLGDNRVTSGAGLRWLFKNRRPSLFTSRVMAHPLLLSQVLGAAEDGKRPSYLAPDIFVGALVSLLSTEYAAGRQRPATPREFADLITKVARDAASQPEPGNSPTQALAAALSALATGADNDWQAYEKRLCAWYESVMERVGGWYKRDTALRLMVLGMLTAALININPLVVAPRLWNDPALRALSVAMAGEAAKAFSAEQAASSPELKQLVAVVQAVERAAATPASTASAATGKAPAALDSRLLGPRFVQVDRELQALADKLNDAARSTGVHSPVNGVARQLGDALRLFADMREQIDLRRRWALGTPASPAGDPALRVLEASIVIEGQVQRLAEAFAAAGHAGAKDGIDRLAAALKAERNVLLPADARSSTLAASGVCVANDGAALAVCRRLEAVQSLNGMSLPIGWVWENWPGCEGSCPQRMRRLQQGDSAPAALSDSYAAGLREKPPKDADDLLALYRAERAKLIDLPPPAKAAHVVAWAQPGFWTQFGLAFAGWLMIAIASTLGAPFWFDLLGKLVKLRGAGATPGAAGGAGAADGTTPPSSAPTGTLTPPRSPESGGPAAPAAPAAPENGAINPVEQPLRADEIRRVQTTVGVPDDKLSGRLDGITRDKIAAWQAGRREPATGELTAAQLAVLLPAAPATAPAAPPPPRPGRTPMRQNGTINVLSEAEVRQLYGDITTEPLPNQPGFVRIVSNGLPGRAQHSLVDFAHPLLDPAQNAALVSPVPPLRVHKRAEKHFKAVFDALQAMKLGNRITSCAGTDVCRHIGRDLNKPLSRHTWAIAIDINAPQNGFGVKPPAVGDTGSVRELVDVFAHYGFAWGGHFSNGPDGMHFELALRDPDETPPPPPR